MAKKEDKGNKGKNTGKKGTDEKIISPKGDKKAYVPPVDKKSKLSSEGIVRIVDTDVSAAVPVFRALGDIKGIGIRYNTAVARIFEEKTKVASTTPLGKLTEQQVALLEDIVKDPIKFGAPQWFVNKPVDLWDGKTKHLLGSDLMFNNKEELDRLAKVKHRKAIRRMRGLPVRGQKTKAGFRNKGKAVGVAKKK